MRIPPFFLALFLLSLASGLAAQNRFAIIGNVRSASGVALRNAEVSFADASGNALGEPCVTNSNGRFRSEPSFTVNQVVVLTVTLDGYSEGSARHTVTRTAAGSNVGTITLQPAAFVMGTVRSEQGAAVKDAVVTFFDKNDQQLGGPVLSDVDGRYKSGAIFKNGQNLTVRAKKTGFSEGAVSLKIANGSNGANTANFTLRTMTVISGFVSDSVTSDAMPGAEVSFFDKEGRLIQSRSTDSRGYYDFETDFSFGEVIKVRAEKKDYFPKEEVLRIVKPEREENRRDFRLPKKEDRGVRLGIRVYNRKRKSLEGAKITYEDRGRKEVVTPTSGESMLKITQRAGTRMKFRVTKAGYREVVREHTLGEGVDYAEIYLEKSKSKCPCWLYASIGLAVASGTSHFAIYKPNYNNYEDLKNLNRENDYNKAATGRRITTVSGGLALGALTGWLICRHKEKQRLREADVRSGRMGFAPLLPDASQPGVHLIGFAYQF